MIRSVADQLGTPSALLLDLDDTLLDPSYLATSIRRTCEELAAADHWLDVEGLVAANAAVWQEYWPEIEERWTLGYLESDAVRVEVWRRTLRRCGCLVESLAQRAATTHAQLERASLELFDDARRLLDEVPLDVPLGLVTNGASDIQREKVRALGIEDHFDVIVVSGEVRCRKPDPVVFRIALAALAVEPSRVWHVGDNLATDVVGANDAGLTSIWLNRHAARPAAGSASPAFEIASLRELGGRAWAG